MSIEERQEKMRTTGKSILRLAACEPAIELLGISGAAIVVKKIEVPQFADDRAPESVDCIIVGAPATKIGI